MEPPAKRARMLLDNSSDDDSDDASGGVELKNGTSTSGDAGFKINSDYARRFEYNKKREELQKLEDKHGKGSTTLKRGRGTQENQDEPSDSEESSSEEEDDQGVLATPALDSEIFATLNAIRSKDPRVYDQSTTFYTQIGETPEETAESTKAQKPMFLRDYHREKLLSGAGGDDEEEEAPKTFAQEQEELKQSVIKEMHATAQDSDGSDEDEDMEDEGGFLIPKKKAPKVAEREVKLDVESADKDPETFLSNFMASRAWVPTERTHFQPLESDDEEEDKTAEAFEQAYNLRFEDPNTVNERLVTHARDTSSKFSVRREEPNSRKKLREAERLRKEEEKNNRDAERARLRKLKIEELEEKVNKIKQAAGIKSSDIVQEDWARLLDEGWDVNKWEQEMQKKFGDDYYEEAEGGDSDAEGGSKKKLKLKKPTWDDDIDIKDLVPDYDDMDEAHFSESDMDEDADAEEDGTAKKKKKKNHAQEKKDKKREARQDRRKIEEIVDKNLDLDASLLPGSSKHAGHFRYRETSPTSYGLTARDILMAEDTQLNQFVGLKKLASFRDPEKKRRDQKKMGKKARLRQWRKDTFGDEQGPKIKEAEPDLLGPLEDSLNAPEGGDGGQVDIREGKKKRKRSKKKA
ncbi:KRRI-Interacting protein 1 [Arachnomyces sp. PD_36]|nr:KRRI-Interacting protein 1 [Arachnomyces sp. PD_36]